MKKRDESSCVVIPDRKLTKFQDAKVSSRHSPDIMQTDRHSNKDIFSMQCQTIICS